MKTEKNGATAIPRCENEHKAFIKERLLHRVPYWQIVDLFIATYPDFQPEDVSWNYYRNRLYQRIVEYATSPRNPMSKEIKEAHAEQDERIAVLAHTDKYLQLITLTNYIERDWQPRTLVRTVTDRRGRKREVYKSNIGELMRCYKVINKLVDDLGLYQSGDGKQPASGPPKPVDPLIAQAMAEGNPGPGELPKQKHWRVAAAEAAGAPGSGDAPRTPGYTPPEAFPSFAGPPPEDEE